MEFVVIVKLSDDFTKRLNIYQGKEGLQIQGFNELNSNHSQLHSVINYRIFYAKMYRSIVLIKLLLVILCSQSIRKSLQFHPIKNIWKYFFQIKN